LETMLDKIRAGLINTANVMVAYCHT
jgi:hypothetical protein